MRFEALQNTHTASGGISVLFLCRGAHAFAFSDALRGERYGRPVRVHSRESIGRSAGFMSRKGWLLFAVMSLLWGVPYLFIRVAVHEVDPLLVTFARVGVATLVLLPVALHKGVMVRLRGRWGAIALLALVQIVGPFTLISFAERYASSSLTSLLIAADPLLVAVFAIWLDKSERVTGGRMAGLLVGITGVVLLLGFDVGGDPRTLFGAGLAVLGAAGYAAGALMIKRPTYASLPSLGVVTAECAIATIVVAPFAAFRMPSHVPSLEVLGSLVGLGVLCTALAWLGFFALVAEVGASRGTVFTYVNPAVAVVLGVLLLHEPVTGWTAAGFLLILLGSWLSTRGRPPAAPLGVLPWRARRRSRGPLARPVADADFLFAAGHYMDAGEPVVLLGDSGVPRPPPRRRHRRPSHLQRPHPRNRHPVLPTPHQQEHRAAFNGG